MGSYMRRCALRAVRPFAAALRDGKLVTIGGDSDMRSSLHSSVEYEATHYPEVDAHHTGFCDNHHDFTISDYMLEHVCKPWEVIKEIHRITSQVAIVNVPCMFNVHRVPLDCFRFLPDSVPVLFEDFAHVLHGTWGNKEVLINWMRYGLKRKKPSKAVLAKVDPRWPILMWIVAYKTTEARDKYLPAAYRKTIRTVK